MSVATEFAPEVYIPTRARPAARPVRVGTVTVLHRPAERSVAPPLRLTRRGVVVVSALVAVLSALLVLAAWLSAPPQASAPAARAMPPTITVRAGDSLWSIATRIAPDRDPQAEIADLTRLNGLHASTVLPGQVLVTR